MSGRSYRGGSQGKAGRQWAEACQGMLNARALAAIRGRQDGYMFRGPLAVGEKTPPVRILNPDGSLREVVTAQAMRRRATRARKQDMKGGVVNG